MAGAVLKKKRTSYDAAFKRKVVQFAEVHGNRAAERQFSVSEKGVREWRKQKEALLEMPSTKRARRGKNALYPETEKQLIDWVTERTNKGYAVTPLQIKRKAFELCPDPTFKASNGWVHGFMVRNGLTAQQKRKKLANNSKTVTWSEPFSVSGENNISDEGECPLIMEVKTEPHESDGEDSISQEVIYGRVSVKDEVETVSIGHQEVIYGSVTVKDEVQTIKEEQVEEFYPRNYSSIERERNVRAQLDLLQVACARKKTHLCSVCSKAFTRVSSLKAHLQIHNGEKPYSCSVCSRGFRYAANLTNHTLIHNGEKPYSCPVCSKAFVRAAHLKGHMLVHSDNRPYSCPVCSKSFRLASHLKDHRLVHTKERRYSCSLCPSTFTWVRHLKDHMLVHKDEKPHTCPLCYKAFIQAGSLKVHMLIHSDKDIYTHSLCS